MSKVVRSVGKAVGLGGGVGGDASGAQFAQQEEARKAALRQQVNALFDTDAAKSQFAAEDQRIAQALRGFYTDDLGRRFTDASRNLRQSAANSGNLGSAFLDQRSRLERENQMGATRIDDAVRKAVADLNAQREGTRANALQMISAGGGADAINAASAGLRNSIDMASSAQKQQLFSDILGDTAFNKQLSDARARDAATLAQIRSRTSQFMNPVNTGGGRIVGY